MCEKYNGWSNHPTWVINLWEDGDHWIERAKEIIEEQGEDSSPVYQLSQEMKARYEEDNPTEGSGVWSDLMGGALAKVNWYELADHYCDDAEHELRGEASRG